MHTVFMICCLIKGRQGSLQGVTIFALGNSETDFIEYVQCYKSVVGLRAHDGLFGHLFSNYSCLYQPREGTTKKPFYTFHRRWFIVCRDDLLELKPYIVPAKAAESGLKRLILLSREMNNEFYVCTYWQTLAFLCHKYLH